VRRIREYRRFSLLDFVKTQQYNFESNSSKVLRSIASEAHRYVRAIEYSVTIAEQGYDMAEEAIALSNFAKTISKKALAEDMGSISYRGMCNAEKVYQGFRDVRVNFGMV